MRNIALDFQSIANRDISEDDLEIFYSVLEKINYNAIAMNDPPSAQVIFNDAGINGPGIEVIIGKNVVKIEADAFASCEAIKTLEIPAGVKEIGARAFAEIDCVKFEIGEEEIPEGQEWTVENLMCDKIVWKNKT